MARTWTKARRRAWLLIDFERARAAIDFAVMAGEAGWDLSGDETWEFVFRNCCWRVLEVVRRWPGVGTGLAWPTIVLKLLLAISQ
jgi:hypothetical protein